MAVAGRTRSSASGLSQRAACNDAGLQTADVEGASKGAGLSETAAAGNGAGLQTADVEGASKGAGLSETAEEGNDHEQSSLPMDPTIFTSDERNANGHDQESPMVPAAGSEEIEFMPDLEQASDFKESRPSHVPAATATVKLHLKSLPPAASDDVITSYFECQGEDVDVHSVKKLQDDEAVISLFGLSEEECSTLLSKQHKLKKQMISVEILASPEAETSSTVVEVSGFSKEVSREFLEMHFESKKSGGMEGALEECVIVQEGIAHLKFNDPEVAYRVLSKEHVLLGSTLQVKIPGLQSEEVHVDSDIYLDQLSVTSSAIVSHDRLSLYFCSLLDLGDEDFTFKVEGTACTIKFSATYMQTELEAMCEKINSNKLKQATLTAQLVKVACSVLVKNILSADIDEEFLELYFNNSKLSGGCNVQDVQLIGGGMAVITFEDHKVLECVLQQQHPKLGKNVTVEKYDEANISMQPTPDVSLNSFELKPADINPLIVKCIHKNAECLAEGLEQLNLKISVQPDCLTLTPLISEMPDNIKKQVIDLINRHFIAKQGSIKLALPEVTQLVTNLKESLLFEFSFSRNGTVLDIAGDKVAMAQFTATLKKIHARHAQTEKTYKLSAQEYQYMEEVILEQLRMAFPKVLLVLDTSSTLKVSGSVADLESFSQHFQKVRKYCSVDVNVSPLLIQYFRTPDGKAKVIDFIKEISGAKICLHFHSSHLKLAFLCEPSCLESAKGIVRHLKKVTSDQNVPLSESFLLVRSEFTGFSEFCDTMQRNNQLIIACDYDVIKLAGFKDDVESCAKTFAKYVEDNSKLRQDVNIESSLWRLFTTHMRGKWDHIVSRARKLKIEFTQHSDTDHPHCTLFGDIVDVHTIADSINRLKSSVHKKVIEIDRPGTCELFRSPKGGVYLRGIESQEKVAIEVFAGEVEETSEMESPLDMSASQANCVTKCTALSNHIRINICLGDITNFEADVIVNAANEDLIHGGGVARTIALKGAPAIQDDCTQFVRRSGKVNTGNIYFTKTTGNLRCKALIHAVGPVWKGGFMKEEELLYKVSMNSLSASQGYRSIVFPAISSGIYGFPIKKCADKMIQAVIDFSKANPASSLREVTFIMLPDPAHAKEASVFIAKLKECLPQDKVHLNSPSLPQASVSAKPTRPQEATKSIEKCVSDKIVLRKGNLLDVKADVYVNSTNTNLSLSQGGGVSSALLKAGGPTLQQECSQKAPIRVGDVADTGPGNLPCQFVFHTALPSYKRSGEKVLATSIQECLRKCNRKGMKSIAFPSIGTGNLGYPNDAVARIIVKEVLDYLSNNKKSCIDHVYLVVFMQDTFDSFKREIGTCVPNFPSLAPAVNRQKKKRASLYSPAKSIQATSADFKSFSINNVTVNITCGDITASGCDVIVNPTDAAITLTGQGVAGAILQKGGDELSQLCHVLISNGKVLDDSTLVLETKATGALKSKSIFHICFEGRDSKKFNKIIVECLQKADRMGFTSIAFPAVGTGVQGYPDEQAATGMITAIHQSSKQLHRLKTIDIVLYQTSVFEAFAQVFDNPSILESGFIKRAKSATMKFFGYSAGKSDVIPVLQAPQHDKLNVLIYAETATHAASAEKKFYNFVDEIFLNDFIDDPLINDLTEEDELSIRKSAGHVEIIIDRYPLNRIQLHGETTKVQDVKCAIVKKLSKLTQQASKRREATQLGQTIRWRRMTSDGPEEYDDITNYEIEEAYSKNPNSKYTHGDVHSQVFFTIKFKEMQEVDHVSQRKSKVTREDILKKGTAPDYWDDMPQGVTLHIVTLDSKSQEYQEVLQSFEATMRQLNPYPSSTSTAQSTQPATPLAGVGYSSAVPQGVPWPSASTSLQHTFPSSSSTSGSILRRSTQPARRSARQQFPPSTGRSSSIYYSKSSTYNSIIRIQRIQNRVLYSQYAARKKAMEDSNLAGYQIERKLFHGTKPDTCPKVNEQGFNRSFAGANATVYGNGVYFARDASYSARSTYSPPDVNDYKYVYYARVLTGFYDNGQSGMIVPPPQDPNNPAILCDSVVDNVSDPSVFVTFNDASNYPDYLIVFD